MSKEKLTQRLKQYWKSKYEKLTGTHVCFFLYFNCVNFIRQKSESMINTQVKVTHYSLMEAKCKNKEVGGYKKLVALVDIRVFCSVARCSEVEN